MSKHDSESEMDIEEQLEFLTDALEKKEQDFESIKSTLNEYEAAFNKLQTTLQEKENYIKQITIENDDKDVELALLQVQQDDIAVTNDSEMCVDKVRGILRTQLVQLRETIDVKQKEASTLATAVEQKDKEIANLTNRLTSKLSENEQIYVLNQDLEKKNEYISKLENIVNRNRVEMGALQRKEREFANLKNVLGKDALQSLKVRIDDRDDLVDVLNTKVETLTTNLDEMTKKTADHLKTLNYKEEEILFFKDAIDKKVQEYNELVDKSNTIIKTLQDEYNEKLVGLDQHAVQLATERDKAHKLTADLQQQLADANARAAAAAVVGAPSGATVTGASSAVATPEDVKASKEEIAKLRLEHKKHVDDITIRHNQALDVLRSQVQELRDAQSVIDKKTQQERESLTKNIISEYDSKIKQIQQDQNTRLDQLQKEIGAIKAERDKALGAKMDYDTVYNTMEKQSRYILTLEDQVSKQKLDSNKLRKAEAMLEDLKKGSVSKREHESIVEQYQKQADQINQLDDQYNSAKVDIHKLQATCNEYSLVKSSYDDMKSQISSLQKQVEDYKNGNVFYEKDKQIAMLEVQLQGKNNVISSLSRNNAYVENLESRVSMMEKEITLKNSIIDKNEALTNEHLKTIESLTNSLTKQKASAKSALFR